jgi:small-conductance mechanosensitive channel
MRPAAALFAPVVLLTALPARGEGLSERVMVARSQWESQLERGYSAEVRRGVEAMLQKDAPAANPSDFNDLHAVVALRNLAARACVLEGAWEDAVKYLQEAASLAGDNATGAQTLLSKVRRQHEDKLAEWRQGIADQEKRMKDLETQPGLTTEQLKLKQQLRAYLEERQAAVAHSEKSMKTIDDILAQLKRDHTAYEQSASQWQGFIAKEKLDTAAIGTVQAYVAQKLEQVKTDDARPRFERLAYGRRLMKLDPQNRDVQRFVNGLMGIQDLAEDTPRPAGKKKARKQG